MEKLSEIIKRNIPKKIQMSVLVQAPELTEPQVTIQTLKAKLKQGDYKITKCAEYQLAGKELPYNIVALNIERDEIRNQINGLEE